MKRFLTLLLLVFVVFYTLSGCGCGGEGENADLVFINNSDVTITAVLMDFRDRGEVAQQADSSPLRRGESFGFEAGEYPVTVVVYDWAAEDFVKPALARITIDKAPAGGGQWFVYACDGKIGLELHADQVRGPGWGP